VSRDDIGVVTAQLKNQWGDAADRIISGSLLGRPSDALEQIAAFVDAGATLVNIAIRPPWDADLLADYIENAVPAMRREFS
jgi:alkanesulfonate monooxygenase SsuD/methylene tetrahydromethanopterin reductase-like flavin-dependent oxidoreductase (luciferase family)